jgi:hypothetical protein
VQCRNVPERVERHPVGHRVAAARGIHEVPLDFGRDELQAGYTTLCDTIRLNPSTSDSATYTGSVLTT